MHTCLELLDQLFQSPRMQESAGRKATLHRVQKLAEALQLPQRAYPCVHVAGSNGKGSVCFKIVAALELSGYRVGLYTSPHLFHFSERIQINRQPIDETSLNHGLEQLFSLCKTFHVEASFFELATLLAFEYFRRQQVDIAVIETGLGGRLDATNIVDPLLTVITSISLEHTQLLGKDLESIAAEKAGILKPGIPCVLGPKAVYRAIEERARLLNCPVMKVDKSEMFFDEENSRIAREALTLLSHQIPISREAIEAGLEKRPPCRFEQRGNVIFDVAHNPDAFARLVEALDRFFPHKKKRFLLGLCKDKEMRACLKHLLADAEHIHLVQAPFSRAAPVELLAGMLTEEGFEAFSTHAEISRGMEAALLQAHQAQELLVVCGSFYIIELCLRQ